MTQTHFPIGSIIGVYVPFGNSAGDSWDWGRWDDGMARFRIFRVITYLESGTDPKVDWEKLELYPEDILNPDMVFCVDISPIRVSNRVEAFHYSYINCKFFDEGCAVAAFKRYQEFLPKFRGRWKRTMKHHYSDHENARAINVSFLHNITMGMFRSHIPLEKGWDHLF